MGHGGTRRRLRDAARVEFAARGFDGTTVAAIAARCRGEQGTALQLLRRQEGALGSRAGDELERLAAASNSPGSDWTTSASSPERRSTTTRPTPSSAACCSGKACRTVRPQTPSVRTTHYREKVARFAAAQRDGLLDRDLDPAHLVFALIALAAWWQTVPQLAEMITGAGPDDQQESAATSPVREHVRHFGPDLQRVAQRKLRLLNAAETINDMRIPPGNRLEKLSGPTVTDERSRQAKFSRPSSWSH